MNESLWQRKWSKEQIKAILLEQFHTFWQRNLGLERSQLATLKQARSLPHAVIISGLRRVGKSTLLSQLAHQLGQSQFYYLNFEDDRFLGFQVEDANDLYQLLLELYGPRLIFIIDEIQNIPRWEIFVRRFIDMGHKFYITGSNASLLSRELGSRLTGRYIPIELFPFSFAEFLRFRGHPWPDLSRQTTADIAQMQQHLSDYLRLGGIPDALKYPELPLLRTLYDDVLYRDIATRYHIDAIAALKELAFFLMSNPASQISFNKLKEQLSLGSVNTVKNYIEYLENSWLLFTINVYDYSVKRQQIAPKKVYAIDTGLAKTVGFAFSPNAGKLLQNLVFLALRQQTEAIYYVTTPAGYEVDFYLPQSRHLIQVSQHLQNPTTRKREVRGLLEAMRHLQVQQGFILTDAPSAPIDENGFRIEIKSAVDWLFTATSAPLPPINPS